MLLRKAVQGNVVLQSTPPARSFTSSTGDANFSIDSSIRRGQDQVDTLNALAEKLAREGQDVLSTKSWKFWQRS